MINVKHQIIIMNYIVSNLRKTCDKSTYLFSTQQLK